MNTGGSQPQWPLPYWAELRVQKIQTKLHRWASDDPGRQFHDVFNLVCDPAFLLVAWQRVRGNRGARSAGVDGATAFFIETRRGVEPFLAEIREDLKTRQFRPLPVRERMIPKAGGKLRRLGIATVRDRVVQAALKLVLEPVFEADFLPCSYGFRPKRRAHDAVAEIRTFASPPHGYEWVLEGDITACFDEIDHAALMGLVRRRITDRRVLALVKAFLKAGIFSKKTGLRESHAGAPQGGIFTPPTQWITGALVTLRIGLCWGLSAGRGPFPDGDAVADGDLLGADQDVFDEQPQHVLALLGSCGAGRAAQLGEEAFQVVGELEVGVLVGGLGVEGIDLGVQARLACAQVRHPGTQFVDGQELFGECLDHGGDGAGGLGGLEFEAVLLPGDWVAGAGGVQPLADLGADQGRVGEQVRDVVPDDGVEVVGADRLRTGLLPQTRPS